MNPSSMACGKLVVPKRLTLNGSPPFVVLHLHLFGFKKINLDQNLMLLVQVQSSEFVVLAQQPWVRFSALSRIIL